MNETNQNRVSLRFGPFELNRRTGELFRKGLKIKLQGQPLQLLLLLIDRPGEIITRDEMRSLLWPEDTFVDFEHSLNSAIKKLRAALRDSASSPKFIETLTRRGYRFIAAIEAATYPNGLSESEEAAASPSRPALTPEIPKPPARRFRLQWTAITALVVAASALLIALWRPPFAHRATNASDLSILLSGNGNLQNPAISFDGKMLAYVKTEGGRDKIQVRRIEGGPPLTLFNDTARETEPAFSPDGERIAFTRYVAPGQSQICIGSAFGGAFISVITGGRDPAWSRDGKRLAFILDRPGQPQTLAVAATNGSNLRTVLIADSRYPFLFAPSWSPDGGVLAVERSMGGMTGEILLESINGRAERTLGVASAKIAVHHPVFTADGKGLIYSSNRSGAWNLWYRSLKDNSAIQLTRGPGPERWPSVSSAGRVVFIEDESQDRLLITSLSAHAAAIAGHAPKVILSHSPYLWAPSISPDGKEIAYSQGEYNGDWGIWITPANGGAPERLTSGHEPQIYGHFSHDGQWLIYFTWTPGRQRVWMAPRSGGAATPLTPPNEDASYGDLSPDGSQVAYTRTENGEEHVVLAPVRGGVERPLTFSKSTVARWSPDGKWVAYSPDRSYASGVFIIHPDGTGKRRLTSDGGWPIWMPGGKRIAFRTLRKDGNQQINLIPLDGGKTTPLDGVDFAGDNAPVDFSAGGKTMAYTDTVVFSNEIWMLEMRQ